MSSLAQVARAGLASTGGSRWANCLDRYSRDGPSFDLAAVPEADRTDDINQVLASWEGRLVHRCPESRHPSATLCGHHQP